MSWKDEAIDGWLKMLRDGFESGRPSHAYIVDGNPREEGTILADNLLSFIFCQSEKKPCGQCRACALVKNHTHPDMCWIEPEKKSRVLSIDQIREVERRISSTSWEGGWKACVLVCADRLNEAASNAFLKTLEEPPGQSLFLLLTDRIESLLPTIVSRCQRVPISRDQHGMDAGRRQAVIGVLSGLRGGEYVSSVIAGRRLVSMLEEARKEIELHEAEAAGGDIDKEVLEARVNTRYKELRLSVLRAMLLWYRDALLCVCGVGKELFHYHDCEDVLKKTGQDMSWGAAVRRIEVIESANRQLERNLPQELVFDYAFGQLSSGS